MTGSKVTVLADGDEVAVAEAAGPDEAFPLESGRQLRPGAKVTAVQDVSGESSAPSPEPAIVQRQPPVLGRVGRRSQLWVGGACFLVDGLVPGATVTASSTGGTYHARSDDGTAIVYRKPLAPREVMEVHQSACGTEGPIKHFPAPDRLPPGFASPVVERPLAACQTQLSLRQVVDGSAVTIERRTLGQTLSGCFPVSRGFVDLETALQENEQIHCAVELPTGSPVASGDFQVGPRPPEPSVVGDLCAGATSVRVTGLVRGQRVSVLQDGVELGFLEAPGSTFDIPVPPLTAGAAVQIGYVLCGASGTTQRKWTVGPAPTSLPRPVIGGPLFECAGVVRVTNLRAGSRVQVTSDVLGGAPLGEAYATASEVDVAVAPLLIAEDHVSAVQSGCGQTSQPAQAQPVRRLGTLPRPVVQTPLTDGGRAVRVIQALPGALLDLYVSDLWSGSAIAGAPTASVPLFETLPGLRIGDKVRVRESICDTTSDSETVPVSPVPPTVRFTAVLHGQPQRGHTVTIDRGETVTLFWRNENSDSNVLDPGGHRVGIDGQQPESPTSTTTYKMTATHAGVSRSASITVNVNMPAPPPPPPPPPPPTATASAIDVTNCHVERRTVNIWQRDRTAGGAWTNLGSLPAQYDQSGNCPDGSPFVVNLQDGHQYEFAAVDPENGNCGGRSDPNAADYVGDCSRSNLGVVQGSRTAPHRPWQVS
ncbi:hypothetical protein [Candidatus Nephthysia bennettiae]|uniref:Uncharacterized protein n=1 Tax=Candidatus Nephthysia bennettiae TaxID=3127016 RepID=A0A934K640_9BACT|nr:hypothetical protein [Candidatus Dormibacteraeota bacterium]MBJ7614611.1 hypothetical protein [Candidatus Dormibacteraeota bacterium]